MCVRVCVCVCEDSIAALRGEMEVVMPEIERLGLGLGVRVMPEIERLTILQL